MAEKKEFTYEITRHYGVLSTSSRGWTKELNTVSWNGKPSKYDIREWSPGHDRMGKGITLTDEEMDNILKLMQK